MDTFQATTRMWLRDLLPTSEPLSNARIMTFGYNSVLFETRSDDRLQDWADYLDGLKAGAEVIPLFKKAE